MKKIDSTQMFFVLSLSIGLFNHVMIIPIIFDTAGRDAWFWVSATGLLGVPFAFVLFFILRKKQEPIQPWLENRIGKWFAKLIIFSLIFFLLTIMLVTVKDMIDWVLSSFLFNTPAYILIIPFILMCYYLANAGLRAISIHSAITLPIVIVLGFLVSTGNIPKKEFHFLFPLFEHGFFYGGKTLLYSSNAFLELIFLIILQHHFTDAKRFNGKTLVYLTVMLIVLIIGPITGSLAEFGPEMSVELRHPAYEQWRLLTIGKYISHTDFFEQNKNSC